MTGGSTPAGRVSANHRPADASRAPSYHARHALGASQNGTLSGRCRLGTLVAMGSAIERVGDSKPEWLDALPHDAADDQRVHRVGELLPDGYEAYLRLFHPFGPWGADPRVVDESEYRSWRSLADEAGVEFDGELTWRKLLPVLPVIEGGGRRFAVADGNLDPKVRARLFSALSAATPGQPLYLYYGISMVVTGGEPVLFRTPIDAIEATIAIASETAAVESPELLWPEDRSWVVCTDYDLVATYVACNRALAGRLTDDSRLEIAEVSRQSRIDDRADENGD
jgi:hypothetical protein